MNPQTTRQTMIISGAMVEVFEYQYPLKFNFKRQVASRKFIEPEERIAHRLAQQKLNRKRSTDTVKRLVRANVYQYRNQKGQCYPPVGVTLTFKDNVSDLKTAHRHFTRAVQRFNYNIAHSKSAQLSYIAVPELQKRGAVHYHVIFFNLPFVDWRRFTKIWGHGYTYMKVSKSPRSWARYMTKYITKSFDDSPLYCKKRYFTSHFLHQPIVLRNDVEVQATRFTMQQQPTSEYIIESPWLGVIRILVFELPPSWTIKPVREATAGTCGGLPPPKIRVP